MCLIFCDEIYSNQYTPHLSLNKKVKVHIGIMFGLCGNFKYFGVCMMYLVFFFVVVGGGGAGCLGRGSG